MNEWITYESHDDSKIPSRSSENPYMGYVYALEYGSTIKIGSTLNPAQRIKTLASNARLYSDIPLGKVAVSPMHTNYFDNEHALHRYFDKARIAGSERFDMRLKEFIDHIPDLEYRDDSMYKEERNERLLEWAKQHFTPQADVAKSMFSIIDSMPEQASEFYRMLSDIARLKFINREVDLIHERVQEIYERAEVTRNDLDCANRLLEKSKVLLNESRELSDEASARFKAYANKYFSDNNVINEMIWEAKL